MSNMCIHMTCFPRLRTSSDATWARGEVWSAKGFGALCEMRKRAERSARRGDLEAKIEGFHGRHGDEDEPTTGTEPVVCDKWYRREQCSIWDHLSLHLGIATCIFFFSLSICSGWSKSICGLVCRGCGVLGGVFGFLGIKSALVASFPYRHIYLH